MITPQPFLHYYRIGNRELLMKCTKSYCLVVDTCDRHNRHTQFLFLKMSNIRKIALFLFTNSDLMRSTYVRRLII